MKIEDIKSPEFLKELSIEELNNLAKDIRLFLLSSISKTGGHLSSNLGVVELTIALHYVFNAPKDAILFDVGHQSYIHKILTGRSKDFANIRNFGGISGFQKRKESIYDCFEAGHSSTALSAALGMSVSRDLNKENYHIVPVVGDGAMMSGLSLEALNQIGYNQKKMIIIFNDNDMSISKNVGALNKSFNKLRISPKYNRIKYDTKVLLKKFSNGNSFVEGIHNIKKTIRDGIVDGGIFEEFGLNYLGPIDGHNIDDLIKAFNTAKYSDGPIVVHVLTKKGKGYEYTENDKTGRWHGVSSFDIETGKELKMMPDGFISYSSFVESVLDYQMSLNQDIISITPAMKAGSALEPLFDKYPNRCFDVGIAEDHAIEFACGLALKNKQPFVSIYSSFLQRAYDQMNHDVCRMNLPVVIGIDRAGIVGQDGDTHHGLFDISFLKSLPNMIITEGKDSQEIADLINFAFKIKLPFSIRFPRGILKNIDNFVFNDIELGKWTIESNNKDDKGIIITYGEDVLKINDLLIKNNLHYQLINARFIKPLDFDMLDNLALRKLPFYIYTTDMISGGIGESILSYYATKGINVKIKLWGVKDVYVTHGDTDVLKKSLNIDVESFIKEIEKC